MLKYIFLLFIFCVIKSQENTDAELGLEYFNSVKVNELDTYTLQVKEKFLDNYFIFIAEGLTPGSDPDVYISKSKLLTIYDLK